MTVDSSDGNLDERTIDDLLRRMRMDPEKARAQREWLANPEIRRLARMRGFDLDALDEMANESAAGLLEIHRASLSLSPFGWTTASDRVLAGLYTRVVSRINAGADAAEVDALMTAAWSNRVTLRGTYGPLHWLYGPDDESIELMIARVSLLDQALDHHVDGGYAAAILIVLSQVDGITFDATSGDHGFFIRTDGLPLEDESTIAGLPGNLKTVRDVFAKRRWRTSVEGRVERHPIMHGRELGYGTEANSCKAFALLGSVIEFLRADYSIPREA